MVEIFGKNYYIDLDGITERCRIEYKPKLKPKLKGRKRKVDIIDEVEEIDDLDEDPQAINIFKYELIKMCLERVLSEFNEDDEKMGALGLNSSTVSFKIAYNTLIKNNILIEDDE